METTNNPKSNRFDNPPEQRHVLDEKTVTQLEAHYSREIDLNDPEDMAHARSRNANADVMDMLHTIKTLRKQLDELKLNKSWDDENRRQEDEGRRLSSGGW